jgi:hypothetical protein
VADTYDIVSRRQTEELLGGTTLQDVIEVGFVTKPSGIYVQTRMALPLISPQQIAQTVFPIAANIESLLHDPNVAAIVYIQDVNAAGQLIDVLEITYQSDDGRATGTYRVLVDMADLRYLSPILAPLVEQLNATLVL